MPQPILGVVTVTYNSVTFLQEFAESCNAQTLVGFRVYCIDNKSTDGTVTVLEGIRDDRWRITLNAENVGIAAGNNQGILRALDDGCEWILLLNNDTSFARQLFTELIDACAAQGWRAVVPKIHYDTPAGHIWYGGGGFNRWKGFTGYHKAIGRRDIGQCDEVRTVDYAPTCAMLVHRDVFRQVGLMDESYFVYFDDTDFCWRLKQAGVKLGYYPRVTVVHKVGGSTGGVKSTFSARFIARNRLYYLRKHFGTFAAWMWAPVFMGFYVARYLMKWWDFPCLKASFKGTFSYGSMKPKVPESPL
jgi:GT2 family glycosyltransferase